MVIRRMNAMFKRHGRILFGLITIVVIVSFLGFLTPGFTGMFSQLGRGGRSLGTVFGRSVGFEELQKQSNRNLIMYSLMYGGISLSNSQLGEMASQAAFPAISQIEAAKRRGIKITDEQVADFIAKLPLFQNKETKKFDLTAYRKYVDNMLTPNALGALELDEAVRGFLTQQAINKEISDSVLVTPGEVKAFYNDLYEKIDVWAGRFNSKDFAAAVKVSDEEAAKYFEANRKGYTIPAKFQVALIVFDFNSAVIAPEEINDAAVEKFYNENKGLFAPPPTGEAGSPAPAAPPLKEIKAKVKTALTNKLKSGKALYRAQVFARDVYDRVGESALKEQYKIFADFAAQNKLNIVQTGWFSETDAAVDSFKEPELVKQAAGVYEQVPVTNAVAGQRAAYVAFVTKREASRPAELSEVKNSVIQDIKKIKSREAAVSAAREAVRSISLSKERLKDVKAMTSPKFEKIDTFVPSDPPYGDEGPMIAAVAENVTANNISEVRDTEYGALVVFVEKRTLPKAEEFEAKRKTAEEFYRQKKTGAAMAAFYTWLETKCQMSGE
jgi:hypothetical protein